MFMLLNCGMELEVHNWMVKWKLNFIIDIKNYPSHLEKIREFRVDPLGPRASVVDPELQIVLKPFLSLSRFYLLIVFFSICEDAFLTY